MNEKPHVAGLTRDDVRLVLGWAYTADAESGLNVDTDWALIARLATTIGADPARSAPCLDFERRCEEAGLDRALAEFENKHGRFPGIDEQMAIRDRLGMNKTANETMSSKSPGIRDFDEPLFPEDD